MLTHLKRLIITSVVLHIMQWCEPSKSLAQLFRQKNASNQSAISVGYAFINPTFFSKNDLKFASQPEEVHKRSNGYEFGILMNSPRNDVLNFTYGAVFSYFKSIYDLKKPHEYLTFNEKLYQLSEASVESHNYLFGLAFRWNFHFSENKTRPFVGLGAQVIAPILRSVVVKGIRNPESDTVTFRDNIFPQNAPYMFFMPELNVGLQHYFPSSAFIRFEFFSQVMLQNFFGDEDLFLFRPFYGIRMTYAFKNDD